MRTYVCPECGLKTNTSECPHCQKRTELVSNELFWCNHCNVPIFDEVCPICGEKGAKFTTDVRPVFPEERLLIEISVIVAPRPSETEGRAPAKKLTS